MWMAILNTYSITIDTLVATLRIGLFPEINDPNNCNEGISKGKLNGAMTITLP